MTMMEGGGGCHTLLIDRLSMEGGEGGGPVSGVWAWFSHQSARSREGPAVEGGSQLGRVERSSLNRSFSNCVLLHRNCWS